MSSLPVVQRDSPTRCRTTAPSLVCEVDVASRLVLSRGDVGDARWSGVWLLVTDSGVPVTYGWHDIPAGGLTSTSILETADEVAAQGFDERASCPLGNQQFDSGPLPAISVLVCTRGRPRDLSRCLRSLLMQKYPAFEIVVVDNDPDAASSADVVRDLVGVADGVSLRYVREPTPGLSHARNAGIRFAHHDHIACIDDDEVAPAQWLQAIGAAFARNPNVGVVTGPILPGEIETEAQALFEDFGGHSKGRQARAELLTKANVGPLYPLPAFGAGGNMAFTRAAIDQVGDFDVCLGAGTPTMGGEDTLFLSSHLLEGGTVAYDPRAFTWHYHRRTRDGLRGQLHGYGRGLSAFYLALFRRYPARLPMLAARVPGALREVFGRTGVRETSMAFDFPRDLLRGNRVGVLQGGFIYTIATAKRTLRPTKPNTRAHEVEDL